MNQIVNQKQIVKNIVKAFDKMESAKKNYVMSVIDLGEQLNHAKKLVAHGEWENWLKVNSELTFGHEQATKFMKVAANKLLVLEFFNSETSVNNLTKAISDATPEQLEKVEQLKQAEIDKRAEQQRKADEAFRIAEQLESEKKAQPLPAQSTADSEPLEGDFKEVKPKKEDPEPEPEHNIELQEAVNILSERNDELEAEILSVCKVFESNDQLATAAAEIKKLTAVNVGLQSRVTGAQNERTELIRTLNYWKKRAEKAEKKLQENGIAV